MNAIKEIYSKVKSKPKRKENGAGEEEQSQRSTLATDAVPVSPPDAKPNQPVPPPRRKKTRSTGAACADTKIPEMPDLLSSAVNTQAIGSVINIINSKDVHWGPNITYNVNENESETKTEQTSDDSIQKTSDIIDLMNSEEEISHEHLNLVSERLGSGWRGPFRNLGYTDGMIELIYESHHHKGIPEVIYQLLLDWTRIEERTLGELITWLWKEGKFAVVRQLCDAIAEGKRKDGLSE